MSLIKTISGTAHPNWIASESGIVARTMQGYQTLGTVENNKTIIQNGKVYPANDATAIGIVYADCDITAGEKPCSVLVAGRIYKERLAEALTTQAETALKAAGIVFDTAPEFERTY